MDWIDRFGQPKDDLGALMWLLAKSDHDGSFKASYRALAAAWGWSLGKVQRFVAKATAAGVIDTKTIHGETSFRVVISTGKRKAANRNDTVSDTDKSDLFGPVPKKLKARGSRLAEDWRLPKPWGDFAVELGISPDEVRRQAEIFRDYWHARAGKEALKVDWQATWRNWIRRHVERHQAKMTARSGESDADAFIRKYQ